MTGIWDRATLTSVEKAARINALGRKPVGAACLVQPGGGQFVVVLRRGAHGAGTWSLPGGWVELGESPDETARREVWEEVGLTVERVEFLGYTDDRHPEGIEGVTLFFRALDATGVLRVGHPDKIEEVRAVTSETLPSPLFEPFRLALLADWMPL